MLLWKKGGGFVGMPSMPQYYDLLPAASKQSLTRPSPHSPLLAEQLQEQLMMPLFLTVSSLEPITLLATMVEEAID